MDFKTWSKEEVARFEAFAQATLPQMNEGPAVLVEPMRYAVLDGGKRIRALLAMVFGRLTQASERVTQRVALALEMVHAYSLVHDDMPEMDNDLLRRGRPTVHAKYGSATGLLTGDVLQSEAFVLLSTLPTDAARALKLIEVFAKAIGLQGMCGGQALDLAMVGQKATQDDLLQMQAMKTGALILASVEMGARCGHWDALQARTQRAILNYGQRLGLIFQIVDDILDYTQTSEVLGKTAGKDQSDNKPTWVSLVGIDAAREKARELEAQTLADLDVIGQDAAIEASALPALKSITQFVLDRLY